MNNIVTSPLFGLVLCLGTFQIGGWIQKKIKSPVANPLLIAIILIITTLKITGIPLAAFNAGGNIISVFLAPATALLALSVYRQLSLLKKYLLPIILGCFAGVLTSFFSAYVLCRLLKLSDVLILSLLPKSVTTPIAMEISQQLGGIVPVTVTAVVITGIMGAILSPCLIKLFHVRNPVAMGVGIGACSHAIGTSKAVEMGEIEGAMSGISLCVSGILMVLLSQIWYNNIIL